MTALKRYFLWFFMVCLIATLLLGFFAALLPNAFGSIVTVVPYLIAMIWTLYRFIRQQQRAPTQQERKKLTLGFSLIFWLYNISFLLIGIWIASRNNPQAWQDFQLYVQQPMFMSLILIMFLLIAIPLYLLTYWFYGKQAERMAAHHIAKNKE